jgi:hypothetical protein
MKRILKPLFPALLAVALLLSGCATPLEKAIQTGNTAQVSQLLDRGADISAKDCNGWTPLILAADKGNVECIRLLLDRGANVNEKSAFGETALYFAAANNHPDLVKLLLDHGADVNCKSWHGWTPLMNAAYGGYPQCAQLLLDHGANLDYRNQPNEYYSTSCTALEWAMEKHHPEVESLIREAASQRAARKKKQIAGELQNAPLAQLLGKNDFNNEAFVAALTDALIEAKNRELPSFIAKSTIEQRTALVIAVEKRLAEAKIHVASLNSQAEDDVRQGRNATKYRQQVAGLQACMTVLMEIREMLNQS